MIALRKDVKVGFTIGGVALGVFGVYLGLSALAGPKPDASMTGANLQLTPFGGAPSPTSIADVGNKPTPALNSLKATPLAANTGPAIANPSQQLTNSDPNGADLWGNAFQTGKLQQPAVTVTPDASRLSQAANNTPKPSDVISAINSPPVDSSKSSDAPKQGTGTASAAEPSGSLADGTSSRLARSNDILSGTPSTQPAGAGQTHTIELGETFSSVAASYYGDAKYYKLIVDANPQIDANKLKPGMVVKIPVLAKKEPKSDTTDVPSVSKIDPTKQYVVKSGDSLAKIATTLYADQNLWQKIYDLNKPKIGDSPARLKLGMVLDLPSPPTQKQ